MGVLAGEVLDGFRCAAVRVAFTQDGVDRAALDLVIARLDLALFVILRLFRVVRQIVTLILQFLDGFMHLRIGGADVWQLDDVGFGPLAQFTQVGKLVRDTLLLRQAFRENRDDPAGQGNIPDLNADTGVI